MNPCIKQHTVEVNRWCCEKCNGIFFDERVAEEHSAQMDHERRLQDGDLVLVSPIVLPGSSKYAKPYSGGAIIKEARLRENPSCYCRWEYDILVPSNQQKAGESGFFLLVSGVPETSLVGPMIEARALKAITAELEAVGSSISLSSIGGHISQDTGEVVLDLQVRLPGWMAK